MPNDNGLSGLVKPDNYAMGRRLARNAATNLLDHMKLVEVVNHEDATLADANRRFTIMQGDAIRLLERLGYDPTDSDLWGSDMEEVVIPLLTAALHLINPDRDTLEEIL